MLIVCPNCSTSYEIELSQLGARGRGVRCARCRETWVARSPALVVAAEPLSWEADAEPSEVAHGRAEAAEDPLQEAPPPPSAEPSVPALIVDAPPLAPEDDDATAVVQAQSAARGFDPPEDIETLASRRESRARAPRRRARRVRGLPLLILTCSAILAALIAWRAEVVRLAPQTAGLYRSIGLGVNLRGLVFEQITVSDAVQDGVPVMTVQGRIINVAGRGVEVPRLRFSLRNGEGVEIYAWTALPEQALLQAGAALPFRSRVASPPPDAKKLEVRFFHRRDLVAGR